MTPISAVMRLMIDGLIIDVTQDKLQIFRPKSVSIDEEALQTIKDHKAFVLAVLRDQKDLLSFLATLCRQDKRLLLVGDRLTIAPDPENDMIEALDKVHNRLLAWLQIPKAPCSCGCLWWWRPVLSDRWYCWRCHFWAQPIDGEVILSWHIEGFLKVGAMEKKTLPKTGYELQEWLRKRGWNMFQASIELHVPWTDIRACLVWPNRLVPPRVIAAVRRWYSQQETEELLREMEALRQKIAKDEDK
jgi:hypothetical protein